MEKRFTFLFTDIEGSTRLWERHPEAMSISLTHHNAVISQAIETHQGRIFKTVGDGFCAVFDSAPNALSAALAAQRELFKAVEQANGPPLKLRVRMAVHTGLAEELNDDYFGPTLNRVARLISAGHGGQILFSAATHALVEGQLPDGADLRDLGTHRLRDLNEMLHIYQLVAADVPTNFVSINSLTPRPTNLPAQLTSFVGREKDTADIARLLCRPNVRLLTLLGPGGIGKTRLSIQIGANLRDEFEDGVYFIALAALSQPVALLEAIAETLNIAESDVAGNVGLLESVKAYLSERQTLLVLDNFEQIMDAAPLLNELLAAAARLKILVTSRERLRVYGEFISSITPLAVPENAITAADALLRFPAAALFVERAQAVELDFVLTADNTPAIAEICRRLDGLPLAIELAAARVREFSPVEIVSQLTSRLKLLAEGPCDVPARQQTIRGAIDWSFNLLTDYEQTTFVRLAVFVGVFSTDAACAVIGVGDAEFNPDVLALFERLCDKSLLQREQHDAHSKIATYRMLEVLREYALERLKGRDELDAARSWHSAYYLELLETVEPGLTGVAQIESFAQLEAARYDLQAALEWALCESEIDKAARMVSVLWRHWSTRSRLSEGQRYLEQVLAKAESLPPTLQIRVQHGAGRLALLRHQYKKANKLFQSALVLCRENQDFAGQAMSLLSLGEIELDEGNFHGAEQHFQSGLTIYRGQKDQDGIARALDNLGVIANQQGDYAKATELLRESLTLARQYGTAERQALVLNNLAEALRAQGNYAQAAVFYQESMEIYRQLDFAVGVAVILHNLGYIAQHVGDSQRALASFLEALRLLQPLEEKQLIAECFAGLGGAFLKIGDLPRSVRLLSASKTLMDALGVQLEAVDQTQYDLNLADARTQLDAPAWSSAWIAGQTLPLDTLINEALNA
ncbi:MAG: tetratricopeptide repeat protein [Burkholderiales bacterium]|nr:tetratricopeptide repeat protein [Anaerolineae bacterium]